MAAQLPSAVAWDHVRERLSAAYADGLLHWRWVLQTYPRTVVAKTTVLIGQRRCRLEVAYGTGWQVQCWLPLAGAGTDMISHALPDVADFLEALALAEQWAQDNLQAHTAPTR